MFELVVKNLLSESGDDVRRHKTENRHNQLVPTQQKSRITGNEGEEHP